MQTRYMMLLLMLFLGGCKIELDIFGKGKVETASGSFNCTNDGSTQSGDCTQTYNVDEEDVACSGTDCTVLGLNDTVEETWVATPEEGNNFNGFTGHCEGGGSCTHSINYGAAETAEKVTIEAHFEPEPPPQEVTYTHNYLGQMASMTVNGVTTFYVYDEQGRRLSEINEDGISIKDYIYAEDQLVAWIEKSGDTEDAETEEQVFYPLTNHLGQTFMTIRADGKLGHEQYTDPFGKVQAMYIDKSLGIDNTGPLPLTDGLPGQYLQPSAYLDNGWRTYDPTRPGYLQPDPRGILLDFSDPERQVAAMMGIAIPDLSDRSSINHMYGYVDQNPINSIDPTGEAGGGFGIPTFSPTGGSTGMGQVNEAGGEVAGQEAAVAASIAGMIAGGAAWELSPEWLRLCVLMNLCPALPDIGYDDFDDFPQQQESKQCAADKPNERRPKAPWRGRR